MKSPVLLVITESKSFVFLSSLANNDARYWRSDLRLRYTKYGDCNARRPRNQSALAVRIFDAYEKNDTNGLHGTMGKENLQNLIISWKKKFIDVTH